MHLFNKSVVFDGRYTDVEARSLDRSKSLCARKYRNTVKDSKQFGIFLISIMQHLKRQHYCAQPR